MAARTTVVRAGAPADALQDNLGPLAELSGSWRGKGFNLVSLPDKQDGKPFRLMLNATMETLAFTPIGGKMLAAHTRHLRAPVRTKRRPV